MTTMTDGWVATTTDFLKQQGISLVGVGLRPTPTGSARNQRQDDAGLSISMATSGNAPAVHTPGTLEAPPVKSGLQEMYG